MKTLGVFTRSMILPIICGGVIGGWLLRQTPRSMTNASYYSAG